MMITGINHITIAVSDVKKSLHFYTTILGFKGIVIWDEGAYLSLDTLWLCLSKDIPCSKNDYSHIAFSLPIELYSSFRTTIENQRIPQWKDNSSEGNSIYFLDPDGTRLEAHCGDLYSRLESINDENYKGLIWL